MTYALLLDEATAGGAMSRQEARSKIDAALVRPFDEEEAEQYDRDRWGMSDEALAAQAANDAYFGDVTYGLDP